MNGTALALTSNAWTRLYEPRRRAERELIGGQGPSRMILVERCVHLKDETYRLLLDLAP
jgi:hypothetical protein